MFRVIDITAPPASRVGAYEPPATSDKYLGSAFQHQSPQGNQASRDEYHDGETNGNETQAQKIYGTLQADSDGVGEQSVYGGTVFRGIQYGLETEVDAGRPSLSFPFPRESDLAYAERTNDYTVGVTHAEIAPIAIPNFHTIPEKPLPVFARFSEHPAEIQPVRPWDTVTGAWPWSGEKATLERPVAAAPLLFTTAVPDAYPSPTGTSNSDQGDLDRFSTNPLPLTFRVPVRPWDTSGDGRFVDSGE